MVGLLALLVLLLLLVGQRLVLLQVLGQDVVIPEVGHLVVRSVQRPKQAGLRLRQRVDTLVDPKGT